MPFKWDIPFNLFYWSMAIFLFFAALQALVVTTFTLTGFAISPMVSLFTWFAVSAAISYTLISRYQAELLHLIIVQVPACFYMVAITFAMLAKTGTENTATLLLRVLEITALLFLCGALGGALSKFVKDRGLL